MESSGGDRREYRIDPDIIYNSAVNSSDNPDLKEIGTAP